MHIIRNERHVRVFSFIGQYVTLAGLLALVAGLIISFIKSEWLVLMLVSLVLGFGLSVVGGFFADRYVGKLAHHDALVQALKGLDNRYILLQYILPVPHLLLESGGCTVFVVKTQGGQVTCQENGRWKHRQRGKFFRQFAGQEALGAPDIEAERQVYKMERWLAKQLPDVEVPVRAAIVFVNPDLTLDAAASPVPAFYGKKVKAWLRGPGKLKPLPAGVHRQLAEALDVDQPTGA
ncbi:MAG: nuclease-related domain-containing protein [Anaerolineae bacterium]